MNATKARQIMGDSREYLAATLESVFEEVDTQASQGLNWAHVNIKSSDSEKFVERVKAELTLLGYDVSGLNSAYNFTIKW